LEYDILQQEADARKRDKILMGIWHDGRLDCVAGNGIMSELGVGDELFSEGDGPPLLHMEEHPEEDGREFVRKQRTKEEMEAVGALPVVLIRNYAAKVGSSRDEQLLTVLARWAAMLAENQVFPPTLLGSTFRNHHRSRLRMSSS